MNLPVVQNGTSSCAKSPFVYSLATIFAGSDKQRYFILSVVGSNPALSGNWGIAQSGRAIEKNLCLNVLLQILFLRMVFRTDTSVKSKPRPILFLRKNSFQKRLLKSLTHKGKTK